MKKSIEKQCLFYRNSGSPDAETSAGHCDLDRRTKCTGEMQFCKKPNALREHLAERGLGWERKNRRRSGLVEKPIKEPTPGLYLWIIMEYIYGLPKPFLLLIAFVMSSVVGVINYMVGAERSSLIFYFVPISMVTWFTKRWMGIAMSAVCALTWLAADMLSQTTFSRPDILYWNGMTRLSSFLLFTFILAILKTESIREKEASRVDPLTGVRNRRFFLELADVEVEKARRNKTPLSIVYIDLDNFKLVNDRFGHSAGDNLLRLVASGIRHNIRATDTIARLGGDEFAILLPQIGVELIQVVTKRIEKVSADLMRKYGWPVTLSMGVVSFVSPPSTVDDLLKASDDLMYSAKKNGKNTIYYEVYSKERASQMSNQLASEYTSDRIDMQNRVPEEAPGSSLAGKYS